MMSSLSFASDSLFASQRSASGFRPARALRGGLSPERHMDEQSRHSISSKAFEVRPDFYDCFLCVYETVNTLLLLRVCYQTKAEITFDTLHSLSLFQLTSERLD